MKHVKLFEQFTANEAYIGPFVFNDSMSDEELKAMYNDALSGYANWQKGFEYPKSDYKKVYQEIQKILKKRGVSIDEAVFIEFLNKDKNFKKDTKHFKSYDEAVKWAKANFDKFNPDMIKYESLKIDELRLTSYGVKDLLKAVNNRLDLLPQLGFDKFKDVIHHLKYGDQEEQNELRDKLKELGVNVAYESKVNEGELNSKVAKKLTIGDTIKTDKHTYTITDFGQKANAFRQFQVEDEAGEIYQIQVSLYGSNSIGVGAGRSLNFRDEVLEALVTEKREDVGKYNTVKKVISKLGRRPSEQDLATFINNNYYDVTEVERGEDDPSANDKIADLVGFYKFDIEDWEIAWADAQNESVVNEAEKYITDEFKVGDKIKTGFGEWEVIETDYAPNKSFMGSFIFKGKDMKRVNIPNPPRTNKNAIGYKVTDGDKYPIIGFLYQYKDITKLATVGVDESVVTEAKTAIRAEVMDFLETRLKLVRTSEEFDGTEGGIWTSAENGETLGGSKIFDYYSESSKYEFGVLNKFAKELSKLGWYCEFYDPGTVMIWEE
jgi:hypothetical protein